jgi:hypothetical protein
MKKIITLLILFVGMVSTVSATNYLKGSWNSYSGLAFSSNSGAASQETVTVSLSASCDYYFFIEASGGEKWFVENGAMTSSSCTDWTLYKKTSNYMKLTTTVAGNYVFHLQWYEHNDKQTYAHLSIVYPKGNQYTVHFKKGNDWSSVHAYRYVSGSNVCSQGFPGPSISENSSNSGYYDLTFNDSYNGIVFSDNGSDTYKSGDVTVNFSYPETWVTDNATIQTTAPDGWIGYTRSVTSGNFGTICLPFNATVTGATVFKIVSTVGSGESLTGINLESVDALEAGKAYIFKATGNTLAATYSGSYTAATAGYGMMGNLSADNITVPDGNYVVKGNKIRKVVGTGGVTVGQYKGYITLADISPVSARGFDFISFEDNGTTAIETVKQELKANGEYFNLAGQRVAQPAKGLYIVNGKKVIMK